MLGEWLATAQDVDAGSVKSVAADLQSLTVMY